MTDKAFVVTEVTWEYNDEYYFRPESGGGTPAAAFLSRKRADEEAINLTYHTLSSWTTCGWGARQIMEFICEDCGYCSKMSLGILNDVFREKGLLRVVEPPPDLTKAEAKVDRLTKAHKTILELTPGTDVERGLDRELKKAQRELVALRRSSDIGGEVTWDEGTGFNYFPLLPMDLDFESKKKIVRALGLELYEVHEVDVIDG